MIPFIDLLMVTVAFLLITAVWVTNSRLDANAQVAGGPPPLHPCPINHGKVLDLTVKADRFTLAWKLGSDIVSTLDVDRASGPAELARSIASEWRANGSHSEASDAKLDEVILHTDNRVPFKEIVAVMDAVYATRRDVALADGKLASVPAFNVTFAAR